MSAHKKQMSAQPMEVVSWFNLSAATRLFLELSPRFTGHCWLDRVDLLLRASIAVIADDHSKGLPADRLNGNDRMFCLAKLRSRKRVLAPRLMVSRLVLSRRSRMILAAPELDDVGSPGGAQLPGDAREVVEDGVLSNLGSCRVRKAQSSSAPDPREALCPRRRAGGVTDASGLLRPGFFCGSVPTS